MFWVPASFLFPETARSWVGNGSGYKGKGWWFFTPGRFGKVRHEFFEKQRSLQFVHQDSYFRDSHEVYVHTNTPVMAHIVVNFEFFAVYAAYRFFANNNKEPDNWCIACKFPSPLLEYKKKQNLTVLEQPLSSAYMVLEWAYSLWSTTSISTTE